MKKNVLPAVSAGPGCCGVVLRRQAGDGYGLDRGVADGAAAVRLCTWASRRTAENPGGVGFTHERGHHRGRQS
eukprot:3431420-Pyramimonas_sp.AAC.1